MASNNKIDKYATVALIIIVVCFICIMCCGIFSSCAPVDAAPSEQHTPRYIEIPGQKYIVTTPSTAIIFYVTELEGHKYAIDYGYQFLVHLASCPCHQKEELSLTLPSTSSSNSLFNW